MKKRQRIQKRNKMALLCISKSLPNYQRLEIQRLAPSNFYNWCYKAKKHYIQKRWRLVDSCCNGVPGYGARIIYL